MCGPIHNYVVRSHCSVHFLTHRPDYLQGVLAFDSLLVCRLAMNLTVKYSGTLTIVHIASFCCLGYVPVWLESYLLKWVSVWVNTRQVYEPIWYMLCCHMQWQWWLPICCTVLICFLYLAHFNKPSFWMRFLSLLWSLYICGVCVSVCIYILCKLQYV